MTVVIGVGNANRGDDGAGRAVASGGARTDALLGIFSGLLIGLGALYTKAMFTFLDDGQTLIGFGVCLPVLITANVVGLVVMQSGFQSARRWWSYRSRR